MSENTKPKQVERVLAYMDKFGGITQAEALSELGVSRLPSRISELKKAGYPITSTWVVVQNRFGEKCRVKRYSMEATHETQAQ